MRGNFTGAREVLIAGWNDTKKSIAGITDEIVKDAAGAISELRCTAQLDTRTGQPNADKKVKGTIHWVSAAHAIDAEVRLLVEQPLARLSAALQRASGGTWSGNTSV